MTASTGSSHYAKEYLSHFFSSTDIPEFAIMLEGPWGSGKTHFIKSFLEERKKILSLSDIDYIYISLFGVTSVNDIVDQIFSQLNPMLSGKFARFTSNVLFRGANFIGGIFSNNAIADKSDETNLKKLLNNLDGKILIFDDFERCHMPISEIMGIINGYVEHDKLKVILIAAENEIIPEYIDEYRRRKEKLIGKTIRISSDGQEVLDYFLNLISCASLKSAIIRRKIDILSIVGATGEQNFRSLRAILLDLDRIFCLLDNKFQETPEAVERTLIYTLAIGIENRRGRLSFEDISDMSRVHTHLHFGVSNNKMTDIHIKAQHLKKTYPSVHWIDPVIPPESLRTLFESGLVDTEYTNLKILSHPLVAGSTATPAWRQIWDIHGLSRTAYDAARIKLIDDFSKMLLCHPGELLHSIGAVIRLSELGDNVLITENLSDFVENYLIGLEKTNSLIPAPELFEGLNGSYMGLAYAHRDSKIFQKIYSQIQLYSEKALSHKMANQAPILLGLLKTNTDSIDYLNINSSENYYRDFAILHHISVLDIADLLIVDEQIQPLMRSIHDRIERALRNVSLGPEIPWFFSLSAELRTRIAKINPPFRRLAEYSLVHYMDPLLKGLLSQELEEISSIAGDLRT
jgi:hypothetical protein